MGCWPNYQQHIVTSLGEDSKKLRRITDYKGCDQFSKPNRDKIIFITAFFSLWLLFYFVQINIEPLCMAAAMSLPNSSQIPAQLFELVIYWDVCVFVFCSFALLTQCVIYFWKPGVNSSLLVVTPDTMLTIRMIRKLRNILQVNRCS